MEVVGRCSGSNVVALTAQIAEFRDQQLSIRFTLDQPLNYKTRNWFEAQGFFFYLAVTFLIETKDICESSTRT